MHHDDKWRPSIYLYKTFSVNEPNGRPAYAVPFCLMDSKPYQNKCEN